MTWFKVDDGFHAHPKVIAAGVEAIGLWTLAGSYAAHYGLSGRVDRAVVERLVDHKKTVTRLADKLVSVGLWHVEGNGWRMHDWHGYQLSVEELAKRREAKALAGKLGGAKSGEVRRSKLEANSKQDASTKSNPRPDPTRPDPNTNTQICGTDVPRQGVLIVEVEAETKPTKATKKSKADTVVDEIYEHYLDVKQRHNPRSLRTRLPPKGRTAIVAALANGFSKDALKRSCEGLYRSEHHVTGGFLSIGYAMRETNIEKFIALADLLLPSPVDAVDDYGPPLIMTPEESAKAMAGLGVRTLRDDPVKDFEDSYAIKKVGER